jgi:hypothetical protein
MTPSAMRVLSPMRILPVLAALRPGPSIGATREAPTPVRVGSGIGLRPMLKAL